MRMMKSMKRFMQFLLLSGSFTMLLAFVLTPKKIKAQNSFGGIEGEYVGEWTSDPPNDNRYNQIPISAILRRVDGDQYSGEFFFTKHLVPCCGGVDHNGTLEVRLEGRKVVSWIYKDEIPNCNGLFEGTGAINEDGEISIEFGGSDCEGEHSGGYLVLLKE